MILVTPSASTTTERRHMNEHSSTNEHTPRAFPVPRVPRVPLAAQPFSNTPPQREYNRDTWLAESTERLADIDKDGIPSFIRLGKQKFYYDNQYGWHEVLSQYDLKRRAREAMKASNPRGYALNTSNVNEVVRRVDLVSSIRIDIHDINHALGLNIRNTKAPPVVFDLATREAIKGVPWANAIMRMTGHGTDRKLTMTPIAKRHFTPGGRVNLRYIPPADRPEPKKLNGVIARVASHNPEREALIKAIMGRALLADNALPIFPILVGRATGGTNVILGLLSQLLDPLTITGSGGSWVISGKYSYSTSAPGAVLFIIPEIKNATTKTIDAINSFIDGYHPPGAIKRHATAIAASCHMSWPEKVKTNPRAESVTPIPIYVGATTADSHYQINDILKADTPDVVASELVDWGVQWVKDGHRISAVATGLRTPREQWVKDRLTPNPEADTVNLEGYADYETYARHKWRIAPSDKLQSGYRAEITRAIKRYHPDTVIKRTRRNGRAAQIWHGLELKPPTGGYAQCLKDNQRPAGNDK